MAHALSASTTSMTPNSLNQYLTHPPFFRIYEPSAPLACTFVFSRLRLINNYTVGFSENKKQYIIHLLHYIIII